MTLQRFLFGSGDWLGPPSRCTLMSFAISHAQMLVSAYPNQEADGHDKHSDGARKFANEGIGHEDAEEDGRDGISEDGDYKGADIWAEDQAAAACEFLQPQ